MSFLGQEEQIRQLQDRFRYLYFALAVGVGILVARLFFLQILSGEKMKQYSEENRIKRVKIAAPRGMIFDRNGTLLVDNRPAFDLEVIPQYLRESKQSAAVLERLSKLIAMPVPEIQILIDKAKNQPNFLPIKIKNDLSRDEVALIEAWKIDMPGVQIQQEIKRTNLYGNIAAHLLGYIGEINTTELPLFNKGKLHYKLGDSVGKFGIEQKLEDTLRGVDGEKLVEVDALGRIKLRRTLSTVITPPKENPAFPGKNVILAIDQDLQKVAAEAFGDKIGALVAIDPNNGEILSMISRPSFDPTEFSRGIPAQIWNDLLADENRPLRDKTIQDHYPPGSVFKVITAIAGLEEGVIDENTVFNCTGSVQLGNRTHHCHKKNGHGPMKIKDALIKSCDVFFYRTAMKLKSVDLISEWALHLGLGKKTGIPLSREVPGLIPSEEWKRKRFNQPWLPGETLSVAIGQGPVLTTVLQLANTFATIANGGTQYRPTILKRIETSDQRAVQQTEPQVLDRTRLKPKTYDIIRDALWGVANNPSGTMWNYRLPGMDFAGKTGTAQVISLSKDRLFSRCENLKFRERHHGLFAGFAPKDNPKIAIAVVTEHSCHGNSSSGAIAQAVVRTYLKKIDPQYYSPEAIALRTKTTPIPVPVKEISHETDEDVLREDTDPTLTRPPSTGDAG